MLLKFLNEMDKFIKNQEFVKNIKNNMNKYGFYVS